MTLLVFWQTRRCEFINFDDNVYVSENPHVKTGLSRENVLWAVTTTHDGNRIPLTLLSLMLGTLPFLLLDYWPLRRVTSPASRCRDLQTGQRPQERSGSC